MDAVVTILATLTLLGGLLAIVLLIVSLYEEFTKKETALSRLVSRHGLVLMLIVSLFATFGSLFLSEVMGWTPCKLCWLQRIFMYPQVILLGYALWKNDRKIAPYILLLSLVGTLIAGIHYYEQIMATFWPVPVDPLIPCDDTGVSCAQTYTFRYGYITVPMMALTAFVLNAIGALKMLKVRA